MLSECPQRPHEALFGGARPVRIEARPAIAGTHTSSSERAGRMGEQADRAVRVDVEKVNGR